MKKIIQLLQWIRIFFLALKNKINPSVKILETANDRLNTCKQCPHYSKNCENIKPLQNKLPGYCTICNCTISIKVFTPVDSDIKCPKEYWKI